MLIAFPDQPQAFEREVFVVNLHQPRTIGDQLPLAAGGDGLGAGSELGGDAFDDAIDQADESVIQAGLNAAHGIAAHQFFGLTKIHHGQAGRACEESVDRHADAGRDQTAEEFRIFRNHVEVDRGAQIDDHAGSAVFMKASDGVDHAVRAHFARVVVENLDAGVGGGRDKHRLALEIALGHRGEGLIYRRHDARNHHAVDLAQIQRGEGKQVAHQDAPLVGSLVANGAQAPTAAELAVQERADRDVGVARVEC